MLPLGVAASSRTSPNIANWTFRLPLLLIISGHLLASKGAVMPSYAQPTTSTPSTLNPQPQPPQNQVKKLAARYRRSMVLFIVLFSRREVEVESLN